LTHTQIWWNKISSLWIWPSVGKSSVLACSGMFRLHTEQKPHTTAKPDSKPCFGEEMNRIFYRNEQKWTEGSPVWNLVTQTHRLRFFGNPSFTVRSFTDLTSGPRLQNRGLLNFVLSSVSKWRRSVLRDEQIERCPELRSPGSCDFETSRNFDWVRFQ
jgi:hypothetical protein